ncbi:MULTISPECIES: BlaI/MecI/CopY family transcriptional regulator [Pseudomonas]|uniref:BlaI/MecI/CopY family transcriptional regulator n=1 Tax=Pseudomonas TaxID=286 RepID=UPI001C49A06C|nr:MULTISPECIES: BlaI/MecI/CopY family transcriptional regulator [Pseudomonas]
MTQDTPDKLAIPPLGTLEVAVLVHLWRVPEASSKEVHAAIGVARGISVNTVQSTLERLYRKKLLKRFKASHAFRYAPQMAREQLVAGLVNEVLSRFGGDTASSLAASVEAANWLNEEALHTLEAELKNMRTRGEALHVR